MKPGDVLWREVSAVPGLWKQIVEKENEHGVAPYVAMAHVDVVDVFDNTVLPCAVESAIVLYVHDWRSLRGTVAMYIVCDTGQLGWTWETGWMLDP